MQAAHRDFLFSLEIASMCRFCSHDDFGIVFIDPRHLVNAFSLQRNDLKINPLGLTHIVSRTILSEKEL